MQIDFCLMPTIFESPHSAEVMCKIYLLNFLSKVLVCKGSTDLFGAQWLKYLIPIEICAPLTFAHLACAKIKGSKYAQYESAKNKGRRKNATNE